jgi:hypothetical protein
VCTIISVPPLQNSLSHTLAIGERNSSSCIRSAVVWLTTFCSGGALMIVRTVLHNILCDLEHCLHYIIKCYFLIYRSWYCNFKHEQFLCSPNILCILLYQKGKSYSTNLSLYCRFWSGYPKLRKFLIERNMLLIFNYIFSFRQFN